MTKNREIKKRHEDKKIQEPETDYKTLKVSTGDLDIWLKPDNENKAKCVTAFRTLKYKEHRTNSTLKNYKKSEKKIIEIKTPCK